MIQELFNKLVKLKKEFTMKTFAAAALLAALALSPMPAALAQSTQATAGAADAMSTGEVRKIDRSTGKMTIKHGPLANLGMDAMTMVFRVSDKAMLDQVKVGDKINFVAEEPNGQLTVIRLEKQQ
ncbi:copper-binding protein [Noviherbaspirillum soli]|uniref:copper-binding protein n=1 Tax=Noviherbaspirillum soli TaxID=1064518 RepID=UPI00389934B1